jgi:hypothetical protein
VQSKARRGDAAVAKLRCGVDRLIGQLHTPPVNGAHINLAKFDSASPGDVNDADAVIAS